MHFVILLGNFHLQNGGNVIFLFMGVVITLALFTITVRIVAGH